MSKENQIDLSRRKRYYFLRQRMPRRCFLALTGATFFGLATGGGAVLMREMLKDNSQSEINPEGQTDNFSELQELLPIE